VCQLIASLSNYERLSVPAIMTGHNFRCMIRTRVVCLRWKSCLILFENYTVLMLGNFYKATSASFHHFNTAQGTVVYTAVAAVNAVCNGV
jgi:hypothetical protein